MKPVSLLHVADPWLGRAGDPPARAQDRLRAFERAIDRALGEAADLLLVAGRMLAPEPPDPALVADLEAALSRARNGGVCVITTCEIEEVGWLDHFRRAELLTVLAPSPDRPDLPTAEPRRDLVVHGLGHPRGRRDLSERIARLAGARRARALNLAILHAAAESWSEEIVAAAAPAAAYLAVGGGPAAVVLAASVRDPGPLTRLTLDQDGEPGSLLVRADGKRLVVEEVLAEDRPLVVVRLDLAAGADLEPALAAALSRARPPAGCVLRLELAGDRPLPQIDEDVLLDRIRQETSPLECRVDFLGGQRTFHGDRVVATTPRDALEQAVIERLAAGGDPALAAVAAPVFAWLAAGDPKATARAVAAVRNALGPEAGLEAANGNAPEVPRAGH